MKSVFDDPKLCYASGGTARPMDFYPVYKKKREYMRWNGNRSRLAQFISISPRSRCATLASGGPTTKKPLANGGRRYFIAPLVFYPTHQHGIAKREQSAPYAEVLQLCSHAVTWLNSFNRLRWTHDA